MQKYLNETLQVGRAGNAVAVFPLLNSAGIDANPLGQVNLPHFFIGIVPGGPGTEF